MLKTVLIMASGKGTNFEAIIKYFKQRKRSDVKFKLLTDNENAHVIKKAKKLKIPYIYIPEEQIKTYIKDNGYDFDLIVLAGFMKILDEKTVKDNKIINIHPSLLPKYKGKEAIQKAYFNKDHESGITIHYVNEKIDDGEIICQKKIEIDPNWSINKFEKEIHKLEHYYYPRIIDYILGLNVLVIGGGAREHAIAEKISLSKHLNNLFLYECNDGFSDIGITIKAKNHTALAKAARKNNISLAIVGSETYLAKGIVDIFRKYNIAIIGADKNTAKLESSKLYAKKVMKKYFINTSKYEKITKKEDIDNVLEKFKNPVIKADGLTGGKGCFLDDDIDEIKYQLKMYLQGTYGKASKTSLVEERLYGNEASLFSFFDGENILHFPLCKDFKQNLDGLNTGGLASICPYKINEENEKLLNEYKEQIAQMLKNEKIKNPFILYSGLMFTQDGLYVLEYNVRLGDPEAQSLLNYVTNDWLEIFYKCANKMLESVELELNDEKQFCIVVASKGYPGKIEVDVELKNLELLNEYDKDAKMYFSNVNVFHDTYYSSGGRVLSVVSANKGIIYEFIKKIDFEEKMFIKI